MYQVRGARGQVQAGEGVARVGPVERVVRVEPGPDAARSDRLSRQARRGRRRHSGSLQDQGRQGVGDLQTASKSSRSRIQGQGRQGVGDLQTASNSSRARIQGQGRQGVGDLQTASKSSMSRIQGQGWQGVGDL